MVLKCYPFTSAAKIHLYMEANQAISVKTELQKHADCR